MTPQEELDLINSMEIVSEQLNRYLSPIVFIFGVLGNILNCLVLSQRALRSNTCALLFLVSSFVDLISILAGLPSRILAGWHCDPTATINWMCKVRAFTVFSTRTLATWLITLATIDRWLLTSVDINRRRLSSLKNVKRGIAVCSILSIASYMHMLVCYEAKIHDQPLRCYGKTIACRLATDLVYALVTIVLPLILMIFFGLMTISNVRHVRTRVRNIATDSIAGPQAGQKESQSRKTDRHLLQMLLVQIIFLVVLCLPQAIQKFHVTFQPFGSGSALEDEIKTFLYNIEILLAFIASGMPFYIYTLTGGTIFRKALMELIEAIKQKMKCHSR